MNWGVSILGDDGGEVVTVHERSWTTSVVILGPTCKVK